MNPLLAQAETEAHLLNGRFDRFAAQNARGGTPDMFPVGARVLVSSVSRGGIPLNLEAATITGIHNGVMSARFDYGLSVLVLRRTYVEAAEAVQTVCAACGYEKEPTDEKYDPTFPPCALCNIPE